MMQLIEEVKKRKMLCANQIDKVNLHFTNTPETNTSNILETFILLSSKFNKAHWLGLKIYQFFFHSINQLAMPH